VAIPPKTSQPIDKRLPGSGLLAHVITNKFAYHLPLYRHEQILAHYGITISQSTLCSWLAWIPMGKETANKTTGLPAYFSL
jgi:transposase